MPHTRSGPQIPQQRLGTARQDACCRLSGTSVDSCRLICLPGSPRPGGRDLRGTTRLRMHHSQRLDGPRKPRRAACGLNCGLSSPNYWTLDALSRTGHSSPSWSSGASNLVDRIRHIRCNPRQARRSHADSSRGSPIWSALSAVRFSSRRLGPSTRQHRTMQRAQQMAHLGSASPSGAQPRRN